MYETQRKKPFALKMLFPDLSVSTSVSFIYDIWKPGMYKYLFTKERVL